MTQLRPLGALLALSLAFAAPALAQTTTGGTGTAPATTQAVPQQGGDPSLGTPAAAAPQGQPAGAPLPTQSEAQVGQTYLSEAFGDWELRCKKTADGADPCLLYQLLRDDTNNPVAEISFFALPAGNQAVAGANLIVPLETLLTRQLGLAIDTQQPKVYPFVFCTRAGCVSKVGFVQSELDALKAGDKAVVQIVPAVAPDKTVTLNVSLKGFTAGFEAVSKTLPPQ